jgi:hypothetical protein
MRASVHLSRAAFVRRWLTHPTRHNQKALLPMTQIRQIAVTVSSSRIGDGAKHFTMVLECECGAQGRIEMSGFAGLEAEDGLHQRVRPRVGRTGCRYDGPNGARTNSGR